MRWSKSFILTWFESLSVTFHCSTEVIWFSFSNKNISQIWQGLKIKKGSKAVSVVRDVLMPVSLAGVS